MTFSDKDLKVAALTGAMSAGLLPMFGLAARGNEAMIQLGVLTGVYVLASKFIVKEFK